MVERLFSGSRYAPTNAERYYGRATADRVAMQAVLSKSLPGLLEKTCKTFASSTRFSLPILCATFSIVPALIISTSASWSLLLRRCSSNLIDHIQYTNPTPKDFTNCFTFAIASQIAARNRLFLPQRLP